MIHLWRTLIYLFVGSGIFDAMLCDVVYQKNVLHSQFAQLFPFSTHRRCSLDYLFLSPYAATRIQTHASRVAKTQDLLKDTPTPEQLRSGNFLLIIFYCKPLTCEGFLVWVLYSCWAKQNVETMSKWENLKPSRWAQKLICETLLSTWVTFPRNF